MKCSCWMMHYNLSRSHRVKPATTSPGSTMQTGFSSCTVGSVYMCVITHAWAPITPPPTTVPPLHFDHSFFSVHRANRVCACVTHSRLQLITSLHNLTDRWVYLWLTHSLKQAQKYTHGCTQTHITRSHWVTKRISATLLCVCVAIYWPSSARTVF